MRCRSVATLGRGKNWRRGRFYEWRGASWQPRSTDSVPTARTPSADASYSRGAARGGVTAHCPPPFARGGSKQTGRRSSAPPCARRFTECARSAWHDRLTRGVTRGIPRVHSHARGTGANACLNAGASPKFAPLSTRGTCSAPRLGERRFSGRPTSSCFCKGRWVPSGTRRRRFRRSFTAHGARARASRFSSSGFSARRACSSTRLPSATRRSRGCSRRGTGQPRRDETIGSAPYSPRRRGSRGPRRGRPRPSPSQRPCPRASRSRKPTRRVRRVRRDPTPTRTRRTYPANSSQRTTIPRRLRDTFQTPSRRHRDLNSRRLLHRTRPTTPGITPPPPRIGPPVDSRPRATTSPFVSSPASVLSWTATRTRRDRSGPRVRARATSTW